MTKAEIRERIRRQKYITGYDNEYLAARCGVSADYMRIVLNGNAKSMPSTFLADQLAELLCINEQEMRAMIWDLNRRAA
ncbi:MAG: hypothetical protein FWF47_06760 [Clostridia bacterium]|nr:hypothetical protein [Clostridia bacterium]